MTTNQHVFGVLNVQQLTKFCKKLGINPEDKEPNFDGRIRL